MRVAPDPHMLPLLFGDGHRNVNHFIGPVDQWIRHRPTEPGIAGSSPAGVIFFSLSRRSNSSNRTPGWSCCRSRFPSDMQLPPWTGNSTPDKCGIFASMARTRRNWRRVCSSSWQCLRPSSAVTVGTAIQVLIIVVPPPTNLPTCQPSNFPTCQPANLPSRPKQRIRLFGSTLRAGTPWQS